MSTRKEGAPRDLAHNELKERKDPPRSDLVRRKILGVQILGGATAFPAEVGLGVTLTTVQAAARLQSHGADFSAARFDQRVGTGTRDWIDGDQPGASVRLAHEAGQRALDAAGVRPRDVVAAVVSTCTPPHITKSFAAQVALSMGTSGAALDLRAGGAGGLEAWALGAQLAASGQGPVLVIGVETASQYANPNDLGNALLFGDGAAALVLGPGEPDRGLVVARSGVRRAAGESFSVPGPLPPTAGSLAAGDYLFQRPTDDYLASLEAAWLDVTLDLAEDIAGLSAKGVAALPYAVTRSQLDRFEAQSGQDVAHGRVQLRRHGCLGVAGPLALAAAHLGPQEHSHALAAAAVGGGISTCTLLWQT